MTHSGSHSKLRDGTASRNLDLRGSPNQQMQTTIYIYINISIKWINNEVLMYSIGNCSQYTVINHNGEGFPVGPFLRLCFPVQGVWVPFLVEEKGKAYPLQYSGQSMEWHRVGHY